MPQCNCARGQQQEEEEAQYQEEGKMEGKRKSSKGKGFLQVRSKGSLGGATVEKRGALPEKEASIS